MRISDWSSDVCSSDLTLCPSIAPVGRGSGYASDAPPAITHPSAVGRGYVPDASPATTPPVGRVGPTYVTSMNDPRLASLLHAVPDLRLETDPAELEHYGRDWTRRWSPAPLAIALPADVEQRSEEHTSELQSLMRISYAVFCLKKKIMKTKHNETEI